MTSTAAILRIFGSLVDVAAFADEHPGGRAVLQAFVNSSEDAAEAFEAARHSSAARALLDTLPRVNSDDAPAAAVPDASIRGDKQSGCWRRVRRVFRTLVSHGDWYNVHKICGLGSLVCFATCSAVKARNPGASFVGGVLPAWLPCALSLATALLSLQFEVPVLRSSLGVDFLISVEQRAHTILFSLRSVFLCLIYAYWPDVPRLAAALYICAAHAAADAATRRWNGGNSSTIRGASDALGAAFPNVVAAVGTRFTAISQIGAILLCLGTSATPADDAYLPLIPIQLSALQLTLKRKGLLGPALEAILYNTELLAAYWPGLAVPGGRLFFCTMLAHAALRFDAGFNKFALVLSAGLLFPPLRRAGVVPPWSLCFALTCWHVARAWRYSTTRGRLAFVDVHTLRCRVASIERPSAQDAHVVLEVPVGYAVGLRPGRHVRVRRTEDSAVASASRVYTPFGFGKKGRERLFEIYARSGPPAGGEATTGNFRRLFADLQPGDSVDVTGGLGLTFWLAPERVLVVTRGSLMQKLPLLDWKSAPLLLSGGTGATPLLAIVEQAAAAVDLLPGPKARWRFWHWERPGRPSVLRERVQALASGNVPFELALRFFVSDQGRQSLEAALNGGALADSQTGGGQEEKEAFEDARRAPPLYVLCAGPPGFVKACSLHVQSAWPDAMFVDF